MDDEDIIMAAMKKQQSRRMIKRNDTLVFLTLTEKSKQNIKLMCHSVFSNNKLFTSLDLMSWYNNLGLTVSNRTKMHSYVKQIIVNIRAHREFACGIIQKNSIDNQLYKLNKLGKYGKKHITNEINEYLNINIFYFENKQNLKKMMNDIERIDKHCRSHDKKMGEQ
jgi:hypothetical protein